MSWDGEELGDGVWMDVEGGGKGSLVGWMDGDRSGVRCFNDRICKSKCIDASSGITKSPGPLSMARRESGFHGLELDMAITSYEYRRTVSMDVSVDVGEDAPGDDRRWYLVLRYCGIPVRRGKLGMRGCGEAHDGSRCGGGWFDAGSRRRAEA